MQFRVFLGLAAVCGAHGALATTASPACSDVSSYLSAHPTDSSKAYSYCGSQASTVTSTVIVYTTATSFQTSTRTVVASTKIVSPSPVTVSSTSSITLVTTLITTETSTVSVAPTNSLITSIYTSTISVSFGLPIQCLASTATLHARKVTSSTDVRSYTSLCSCLSPVTRVVTSTFTRSATPTTVVNKTITSSTTLVPSTSTVVTQTTVSTVTITQTSSTSVNGIASTLTMTTVSTTTVFVPAATSGFALRWLDDSNEAGCIVQQSGAPYIRLDYCSTDKQTLWSLNSACQLISANTATNGGAAGSSANVNVYDNPGSISSSQPGGANDAYQIDVRDGYTPITCSHDQNYILTCSTYNGANLNGYYGNRWTLHSAATGEANRFNNTIVSWPPS